MIEYSKNYNTVWDLYQSKLNRKYQAFYTIRKDVKVWLVNEKEKRRNSMQVAELISLLENVFEFGDRVQHSFEFIECCSFNLSSEYIQRFRVYLNEKTYNLELKSVSQIIEHQKFIELGIEKIKTHMENTYVIKPYREALMNFSETECRDTLNKNIIILKNKIKELRYLAPKDKTTSDLLKNMLDDVSGLEYTQKYIFEKYQGGIKDDEPDLKKHFSIESALNDSLSQLKELE